MCVCVCVSCRRGSYLAVLMGFFPFCSLETNGAAVNTTLTIKRSFSKCIKGQLVRRPARTFSFVWSRVLIRRRMRQFPAFIFPLASEFGRGGKRVVY